MRVSELAARLAVTPAGAILDRYCVRFLDESPLCWVFTAAEGGAYRRPLLLTTRGRKSGRRRSVVLPYSADGPARLVIIASKGGAPADPHWAFNLRANPEAHVHLRRREVKVLANVAEGDERARLWGSISARAPIYTAYQERARGHREIPVIVLQRANGGAFEVHDA